MNIPFWEDSYKDDTISTFGTEPNATIIEFENLYNKAWIYWISDAEMG